jgi:ATP-dependent helicase YprA (DUF1998 family)
MEKRKKVVSREIEQVSLSSSSFRVEYENVDGRKEKKVEEEGGEVKKKKDKEMNLVMTRRRNDGGGNRRGISGDEKIEVRGINGDSVDVVEKRRREEEEGEEVPVSRTIYDGWWSVNAVVGLCFIFALGCFVYSIVMLF